MSCMTPLPVRWLRLDPSACKPGLLELYMRAGVWASSRGGCALCTQIHLCATQSSRALCCAGNACAVGDVLVKHSTLHRRTPVDGDQQCRSSATMSVGRMMEREVTFPGSIKVPPMKRRKVTAARCTMLAARQIRVVLRRCWWTHAWYPCCACAVGADAAVENCGGCVPSTFSPGGGGGLRSCAPSMGGGWREGAPPQGLAKFRAPGGATPLLRGASASLLLAML